MPDLESCAQIRVLGDEGGKEAAEAQSETDDVFLKKIEATMLTQVPVQPSMHCWSRLWQRAYQQQGFASPPTLLLLV